MQIQDLLEHNPQTIKLLKQIKISEKTGQNTVPPILCFFKSRAHSYYAFQTPIEYTKHHTKIHNMRLTPSPIIDFYINAGGYINKFNYQELVCDLLCIPLYKPANLYATDFIKHDHEWAQIIIELRNPEFEEFLQKIQTWQWPTNYQAYIPILVKAAQRQAALINYPFRGANENTTTG